MWPSRYLNDCFFYNEVNKIYALNPFDLTSQPSGNHQIHNDNGISEFSIPLSLNLPPNDVTTTASVRQPTSNNSSDTTTSQQSHRRKQAFPVSMPIGSEEIQLPVTISNRPFSNPPSGSVSPEKTVVNTLARESSNSSYVSASTLDDDTGDETDLVFLGFTQVAVSRKRLVVNIFTSFAVFFLNWASFLLFPNVC
ncbi:unnamed protein product [Trichobilharzia regenti]|nr:unnamed protein product [Trichobilharzia regenti]